MINLSEATAAKRRIPFYLFDTTGTTPQTGKTFSGSEIQLSQNGATFANFAGTVTEVGSGLYYYETTLAEAGVYGFLALKIVKSGCKTILQTEVIGGPAYYTSSFRLPMYLVDSSGAPVTGLTFSGTEIQISENGASFTSFGGSATEVGSGLYYYTPLSTEYDGVGFVVLKVVKTGVQTYVISQDLDEGRMVDGTSPTVTIPHSPITEEDYAEVRVYDDQGLNYIQITVQDRSDGPKLIVYESANGFFHPFNGLSTVTGSGTSANPYIFQVYRRGRWPTGLGVVFRAKVVDASGNLTEVTL